MRRIPLCIPAIGDEEIDAVSEVLRSGWMAHGPKNKEFEALFCDYLGVRHAISMNSCASTLLAALLALDVRGEVITPSYTFVATVNSILLANATPVFADIDDTLNMSPEQIEAAITDRTEAIMIVHYAGLPADMPAIIDIAQRHDLRIIEDSAECLGGTYGGTRAGGYDVGCFSFFPTKNITTGEGGMLVTNDDDVAARAKTLGAHGLDSSTYEREKAKQPWLRIASMAGFNFRMSNALAAVGVEQMKKLERLNRARQAIADRYVEALTPVEDVRCPLIPEGFTSSWQMFTIQVEGGRRDELLLHLRERGIEASVHFEPPVHLQPPYQDVRRVGDLAKTESVASSIITLPIFPGMSDEDVDYVCEAIRGFFAN
jgi:perosamine synthetase